MVSKPLPTLIMSCVHVLSNLQINAQLTVFLTFPRRNIEQFLFCQFEPIPNRLPKTDLSLFMPTWLFGKTLSSSAGS